MEAFRPLLAAVALSAALDAGFANAENRAVNRDKESNNSSDLRKAGPDDSWERTHRATKIIGTDVRNLQGDDLGDIKEIVLNPNGGSISYVIVSMGGVMGVGDKLYAVPWKALKLDTARNEFVLNADKTRLKNAPAFEANRWPDMANDQWNSEVHRYYGQRYEASGRVGASAP
ncbi:MAG TPA: PRC-barrel domain-containing protein [Burkholderiales bacterium]|nr:PRC-barrel domain-containing protein [Burkholderiales bacterium]